jgi:hypothetical protein
MPVLTIQLAKSVVAVARQRAEASGVPVERWVREIVESYVASERCAHRGALPRRRRRSPTTPIRELT